MKNYIEIPVKTSGSYAEFHKKDDSRTDIDDDTLIFGIPYHAILVDAKQLYAWLKDHYEHSSSTSKELDDRQYICASSLY